MNMLTLHFEGELAPQLERTEFGGGLVEHLETCRGKTCGALRGFGTFQWTSAVRALCVLLLRTAAGAAPSLAGEDGSLASSLDYAISKKPLWLIDMFGLNRCGEPNVRKIILRSNPERRRPGPVVLAVNPSSLPPENIRVSLGAREVVEREELLALLQKIGEADAQPVAAA